MTLEECGASKASLTADRYLLELMAPGEDGYVHEDDDFRTPLHRITCFTCVGGIAERRTKKREEAFGEGNGPREIVRHTRLVAEAYARLADPSGGYRREPQGVNRFWQQPAADEKPDPSGRSGGGILFGDGRVGVLPV